MSVILFYQSVCFYMPHGFLTNIFNSLYFIFFLLHLSLHISIFSTFSFASILILVSFNHLITVFRSLFFCLSASFLFIPLILLSLYVVYACFFLYTYLSLSLHHLCVAFIPHFSLPICFSLIYSTYTFLYSLYLYLPLSLKSSKHCAYSPICLFLSFSSSVRLSFPSQL